MRQYLGPSGAVSGHIAVGDDDFFNISVITGDQLTITTATPTDGPGHPVNLLDPAIELLDPFGVVVAFDDNSGSDGRNALVSHLAAADGTYTVRLLGAGSTEGEYTLFVSGANGAAPLFFVESTEPADGARLSIAPSFYKVTFNSPLDLSTLQPEDLTVDGSPLTSIGNILTEDTIVFELPSLSSGVHNVEIADAAILNLQGTPVGLFQSAFTVDLSGPRVIASSILEGDIVPAGDITYVVQFDEELATGELNEADVQLIGQATGPSTPTLFNYDVVSSTLTIEYTGLVEDIYSLTLQSGSGAVEDVAGNPLDGEQHPLTTIPSGDGNLGGDFVVNFEIDIVSALLPTPLRPISPLGSLTYETLVSQSIGFSGDLDRFTINLDEGQFITLVAVPDPQLAPTLVLSGPSSGVLGVAAASSLGAEAVLMAAASDGAGVYSVTVGGANATTGDFTLQFILNAAVESELHSGAANDDQLTAQSLEPTFVPLTGSAAHGAGPRQGTGISGRIVR